MDLDWWVSQAMIEQGGSFVSKLGALFRAADESNRSKIKQTWNAYWQHYTPLGEVLKAADDAKDDA